MENSKLHMEKLRELLDTIAMWMYTHTTHRHTDTQYGNTLCRDFVSFLIDE